MFEEIFNKKTVNTEKLSDYGFIKDGGGYIFHADLPEEDWLAIAADAPALTPEEKHLLHTALTQLSEEESRIVLLHAVTGLKHREIAALLGLPLPTALSKYHRALKKLKKLLEGEMAP